MMPSQPPITLPNGGADDGGFYEKVGVLPEPVRVSGQRRYGADTVRRLQILDVAKRAGFTLKEAAVLLTRDAQTHQQLRELAARKLPEVDALIAQAQAVRGWLSTATDWSCATLDVCGLFGADAIPGHSAHPPALSIIHVGEPG